MRLALASDPIAILPLGDSITQGEYHPTSAERQSFGYRAALQQMLVEHEIDYDFVGSEQTRCREANPLMPFDGFDPDHEGHWGWTAAEMLEGRWESTCGELKSQTLPEWFDQHEQLVDVVLLHLGTNEIIQALPSNHTVPHNDLSLAQLDDIAASIESVVETIDREVDNPDLRILVAEIIPGTLFELEAEMLNAQLATKFEDMPSVVMVDHFSDFDPNTMTYDAVHPNTLGQQHMAERWFAAIHGVADCVDGADQAMVPGVTVEPNPVEANLGGDANLDGVVDFNDFLIIAANYNQEGTWSNGDFDGDGLVSFTDFLMVSRNFGLVVS